MVIFAAISILCSSVLADENEIDIRSYIDLGVVNMAGGDFEGAFYFFDIVLKQDPYNEEVTNLIKTLNELIEQRKERKNTTITNHDKKIYEITELEKYIIDASPQEMIEILDMLKMNVYYSDYYLIEILKKNYEEPILAIARELYSKEYERDIDFFECEYMIQKVILVLMLATDYRKEEFSRNIASLYELAGDTENRYYKDIMEFYHLIQNRNE
jgi:hypothetical protein